MKKESGMFKLEPDKFSVHTFEISKKLTNQDYKRMREGLYRQCPKGEVYRDRDWQGEGERHRCRWFQRNGVRISLEKDVHGQISTCYLRIAVNPRKLIDPNSSYLGILPPTEESVQEVSKTFFAVLKDSGLPCVLGAYQLSRVLRFEVHELRERISKVEKKLGTSSVTSLLCHYVEQSEKIITHCFGRAYPDKKFMQPDQLRSLIYAEADTALKVGMSRLVEVMVGSLPAFWHVPSAGRTLLGLHYCSAAMICSQYAFS